LYKLIGSKQVGKASITGMRVLNYLRGDASNNVAIWPFETPKASAIVEIYPTMFRKRVTHSVAKVTLLNDLNRGLAALGSQPMPGAKNPVLSDHQADALISAAGLRYLAHDAKV
jgi:hypothetical protein